MKAEQRTYEVGKLVEAFRAGSLLRNPEYQRGEAWSDLQKARLIDSMFRAYPVPSFFFYEVRSKGLDESDVSRWEIVDGQQRLTALRDFIGGTLRLEPRGDKSRLRLPKAVSERPAPWAGRYFSELSPELQASLLDAKLVVYVIGHDTSADEIRDLFIRLQSGTALSRQQVRDAWPGNLGPYVKHLAGGLDQHPSTDLFEQVDKRGQRLEDEDARDVHVSDRQLCAQLLRIFVQRERDPYAYPSISANNLDDLYHELTDFDPTGPTATRFVQCLDDAARVFRKARGERWARKNKFRRLDVTAVVMFLQDVSRSQLRKLDAGALAEAILDADKEGRPSGKSTSGTTLEAYYSWWREHVAVGAEIHMDERRLFDADQRAEIRKRAQGMCQICGAAVDDRDAEFDHFPIPWRDGGRTDADNGRLVHAACHPRGRPVAGA